MRLHEVRPHDPIGVTNWRTLQRAHSANSSATLRFSDAEQTYTPQQSEQLYRWAKLHLDRNEQHRVFDKLSDQRAIQQLLPNLPTRIVRETSTSKTKSSRNEAGYKNWNAIQYAIRQSSPTVKITVGDRPIELSKTQIETLYRWIKRNFKTKHERELYDFLANSRLLELLKPIKSLNELASSDEGDRPQQPLSLEDIAKIIKAKLGSDWTMKHSGGQPRQSGYKFIPADKTKHAMGKIWCVHDNRRGEYPTYNTILYSSNTPAWHAERALPKTVANALATAQLIFNNPGGVKEASLSESSEQHNPLGVKNWDEIKRAYTYRGPKSDPLYDAKLNFDGDVAILQKSTGDVMRLHRWCKNHLGNNEQQLVFNTLANLRALDKLVVSMRPRKASTYKSQDSENVAEAKRKRKSRRSKPARTVYGGWWGMPYDNSSGDAGGDGGGVEESVYREGGSITHDGVEYDFDTVMSIAEKLPTKQCSVDKLAWILKYDIPRSERVKKADIKFPLIVTKSSNGKLAVIDGLHRLAQAVQNNVKTLPVKYVKSVDLQRAKLSKQGVAEGVKEKTNIQAHRQGDTVWIDYFEVTPKRQGYGTKKYQEWENALPSDVKKIKLIASDAGEGPSQDFWDQMGFEYVYDDDGPIEMIKHLHRSSQGVAEGLGEYSDEEIERYGPELIQQQRNLDLLSIVFGYKNIRSVARALRMGNLKRRLRHNEGTPEERSRYARAIKILDSITDDAGELMPHTDTTMYRRK